MVHMTEIKTNTNCAEVFPQRESYRMIAYRRKKEKKLLFYKKLSLIALVVLLVILSVIFIFPSVKAKAGNKTEYETRFVSVRIAENDSLWSIAERFYCSENESISEYVDDIKKMNHLTGDTIFPDTYLVVRHYIKK